MRIIGIDEVGRGCLAGPLVAAAVLLKRDIQGLKDSKLLTRLQRKKLSVQIMEHSFYGLGWVTANEVDQIGLTAATQKAMQTALSHIEASYDEVIIDGKFNFLPHVTNSKAVIKADNSISAVSAASILAKVARDEYMINAAKQYPNYQFEKHVGYGTRLHHELLKLHGICDLHRLSYKPIALLVSQQSISTI